MSMHVSIFRVLNRILTLKSKYHLSEVYPSPLLRGHLNVNVAEITTLATHCIHQLSKNSRLARKAQVDFILKRALSVATSADSAANSGESGVEVLELPDPPDAVNHGVVEVEDRVAGGGEDVLTKDVSHVQCECCC